jgi:hypothetical protein
VEKTEIKIEGIPKPIFIVVAIAFLVLGITMGYFGAKQELVNDCYVELCEEGYRPTCREIDENKSLSDLFLDHNNSLKVNLT